MEDVIIIVPSHKRQVYLPRVAWYYSQFSCQVYICDSTPGDGADIPEYQNINYLYCPELGFYGKILRVINETSASLYVLSPDDDFLKQETLDECVNVLRKDNRYSLAIGGQVFWDEGFQNKEFKYTYGSNKLRDKKIVGRAIRRAITFWPNYQNVLWSVFSRETILEAFTELEKTKYYNQNFIELTLSATALQKGWIYVSGKALNFREYSLQEHWGKQVPEINGYNIKNIPELKEDTQNFITNGDKYRSLGIRLYTSANSGLIYFFKRVRHLVCQRILKMKVKDFNLYHDSEMEKLIEKAMKITNR